MNPETVKQLIVETPGTSYNVQRIKRKHDNVLYLPVKKAKIEYKPQGLAILKSNVVFSSTPAGEIVCPQALIDAIKISGMCSKEVFSKISQNKRWSLATNMLYLDTFPDTIRDLKDTCYHEHFLSESEQRHMLGFCKGLTGLKKVRTPEPDGNWLERDTMWYSFVDVDGFSTVYRGGSCDYHLPKEVKPRQFKMDAAFGDIVGSVRPLLLKIRNEFGENPNHCVITRYNRTYDGIGHHTDKTKDLVRGSSIFVFTFGAAKTFEVVHDRRAKLGNEANTVLELEPASGSLIHMPWDMNQVFEHGIKFDRSKPLTTAFKETREERTDFHTESRYSITFRTKCTWYNPCTKKSYIDKQVQYSSMQPGGAVRFELTNKKNL